MITVMGLVLILAAIVLTSSMNPVKTSMALLFYSSILFTKIYLSQASPWIAMLMVLLFMGGILMMFMILSSVMPNENTFKNQKFVLCFILPLLLYTFMIKFPPYLLEMAQKMKWFAESSTMVLLATSLIIVYFFFFILILSKEKFSMRNYSC